MKYPALSGGSAGWQVLSAHIKTAAESLAAWADRGECKQRWGTSADAQSFPLVARAP